MGSELRSSGLEGKIWLRLCEAVGGVFDSGGDINVGVAMSCSVCAFAAAAPPASSRAIEMIAPGCEWWVVAEMGIVPKRVTKS
jgi:hypothetical protein